MAGTTALTTLVAWAITLASNSAARRLGSPVEITVEADPTQSAAFGGGELLEVILPDSEPVAPDPGPGCGALYEKSRAAGGADANQTRLHAFIRRASSGTAVISQAVVVVDERLPKLPGNRLVCSPEAELENRELNIDLDVAQPQVHYSSRSGKPFGFSLKDGEVETFTIRAVTASSLVRWHIELEVVEGKEKHTVRLDDGGKPFATSAVVGRSWGWNGSSWKRVDESGRVAEVAPGERFDDG